jgi:hypothetical protein
MLPGLQKKMIIHYSRLDFEGNPYDTFVKEFTGDTAEEVTDKVYAYEKADPYLREEWRRWFMELW